MGAKSVIMAIAGREGNKMTKVVVKNGKVDEALRSFKQKVIKNGHIKKIKEKEHYSKPGVRRRNAKKEYIKNCRKRDRKNR